MAAELEGDGRQVHREDCEAAGARTDEVEREIAAAAVPGAEDKMAVSWANELRLFAARSRGKGPC